MILTFSKCILGNDEIGADGMPQVVSKPEIVENSGGVIDDVGEWPASYSLHGIAILFGGWF